jgi:hypothetical protein
MNYIIKSILLTLFVLMSFNAYAVSFRADAVQHRGTEVSHAKMFWNDGSVRATQWYDPELDIVVRQQADDGAIDELRNIRLETASAEMFAIPEGYRTVDSQLTDVNTETSITFGTANK